MTGKNIVIVGVGGQGVVLASNLLAEAALKAGFDVKKTDTLGMAQRGGSVVSHLRYANSVASPLIPVGEADLLIAFEKLEAARWAHFLKPGGLAIVNDLALPPLSVTLGSESYPSDQELLSMLSGFSANIKLIAGSTIAANLGNQKMVNTVLLGYASTYVGIEAGIVMSTIEAGLPEKLKKINLAAFEKGRSLAEPQHQ
ncbi:MAG: indolepyruvate oxidoreductase subunit beta [Dehalogenimonas sp.]